MLAPQNELPVSEASKLASPPNELRRRGADITTPPRRHIRSPSYFSPQTIMSAFNTTESSTIRHKRGASFGAMGTPSSPHPVNSNPMQPLGSPLNSPPMPPPSPASRPVVISSPQPLLSLSTFEPASPRAAAAPSSPFRKIAAASPFSLRQPPSTPTKSLITEDRLVQSPSIRIDQNDHPLSPQSVASVLTSVLPASTLMHGTGDENDTTEYGQPQSRPASSAQGIALTPSSMHTGLVEPMHPLYQANLSAAFDDQPQTPSRVFGRSIASPISSPSLVLSSSQPAPTTPSSRTRRIQRAPIRILDAPALKDDFYLSLIDWGASNIVAVALGSAVWLWNAQTEHTSQMCSYPDGEVCSVRWMQDGVHLAVGLTNGQVDVYDVNRVTSSANFFENDAVIRTWQLHTCRVSSIAASHTAGSSLLASGSRDRSVFLYDIRSAGALNRLTHHCQEVCGLQFSPGDRYLATGANDNTVSPFDSLHVGKLIRPSLL